VRITHGAWSIPLVCTALLASATGRTSGQEAAHCRFACGLVLGASAFTVGTGVAVAEGRLSGGLHSSGQALTLWGLGAGVTLASGLALSEESDRQRRAVYASGIGTVAGALLGFAARELGIGGEDANTPAAALIGAAAGALVAGVYGALSWDDPNQSPDIIVTRPAPLWTVRIRF
jgi:hypothetical protein